MASSGLSGAPSLWATTVLRGQLSADDTSAATTTPPRGIPRTSPDCPRYRSASSATRRPASRRSANCLLIPCPFHRSERRPIPLGNTGEAPGPRGNAPLGFVRHPTTGEVSVHVLPTIDGKGRSGKVRHLPHVEMLYAGIGPELSSGWIEIGNRSPRGVLPCRHFSMCRTLSRVAILVKANIPGKVGERAQVEPAPYQPDRSKPHVKHLHEVFKEYVKNFVLARCNPLSYARSLTRLPSAGNRNHGAKLMLVLLPSPWPSA